MTHIENIPQHMGWRNKIQGVPRSLAISWFKLGMFCLNWHHGSPLNLHFMYLQLKDGRSPDSAALKIRRGFASAKTITSQCQSSGKSARLYWRRPSRTSGSPRRADSLPQEKLPEASRSEADLSLLIILHPSARRKRPCSPQVHWSCFQKTLIGWQKTQRW